MLNNGDVYNPSTTIKYNNLIFVEIKLRDVLSRSGRLEQMIPESEINLVKLNTWESTYFERWVSFRRLEISAEF